MKIKMNGLYGLKNAVAFYKKVYDCFEFTGVIDYASELTKEEAEKVLKDSEWYCKMYGAESMEIVK